MDSTILKVVGAIMGFVILQLLWSLVFKAGNAVRRAIPEGKGSEIAHRLVLWIFGLGFVAVVFVSCVEGISDDPGYYDEPSYRGRR